jgi:lysophospholipase L1-like esterase
MTADTRERLRRGVGVALLALGGLGLALVGAELAARVFWEPFSPSHPPVPEAYRDLPDLRTAGELSRPNLRALNAGALFETNSAGFRGRERARPKPAGVFRIALIGDSLAMGWGVAEPDTYAARVEAALSQRAGAGSVEVLNFGLAGLDAVGAVSRFETLALGFEPDLAVYGFTLNDLENEHYRHSAADLGAIARVLLTEPSYLWRVLAPRIGALREVLFAPPGTVLHELDDNWFHNDAAWQTALGALDRLAAAASQRRICAVLLIHPQLHYLNVLHPYHRHYAAIAKAAEARGFFVVRPIGDFLGRKDRTLWVAPDDPHPGPEAHALLAARLVRELEALPASCRVPGPAPARG